MSIGSAGVHGQGPRRGWDATGKWRLPSEGVPAETLARGAHYVTHELQSRCDPLDVYHSAVYLTRIIRIT